MLSRFRLISTYLIATALGLCHASNAVSGIMLDAVPEANYVAHSNLPQFDAMGEFTGGTSGTLIAPNWVLTAGHVGAVTGFQIRGSGPVYGVAEIIEHPTFVANGRNINFGFDLQLVRLNTDVVGVAPAQIYRGTSEQGSTLSITGFGLGGVGSVGANRPTAQRAGTNVIDAIVDFADAPGRIGAKGAMLIADFDSGDTGFNTLSGLGSSATPTSLEYHLAGGDSGGGVFIFENGQWYLAGVNSGVQDQRSFLNPNNPGFSNNLFGYGAISYITRVSSFTGFIDSRITAVPEPTSLALVGLVVFSLAGRKVLKHRKARNT